MSISFRTGQYVDPSGFPLAVVNVPALDPNTNISLVDNSYTWEENITSSNSSLVTSYAYISTGGVLPAIAVNEFLITNQSILLPSAPSATPLYYQHICRFYHYTYGNNPSAQVIITDSNGVALPGLAYVVQAKRVAKYVYQITVLTAFRNPIGSSYKIQYNRCSNTGTNIYPNWSETLSVTPLFVQGVPTSGINQYLLLGPSNGLYTIVVPTVPTLSPLMNTLGVSIVNSPGIITNTVANNTVDYFPNTIITYTITATSGNTFIISRDHDPSTGNAVTNSYLSSQTSNTWGTAATFTTGTNITGIPGINVIIHTDNVLVPNDQAYFQATTSFYYLNITAYESIYLVKPVNELADNDWYMSVANGSFNRTMNASGVEAPVGSGAITYQYAIPEYGSQVFASGWGQPYMQEVNERPQLVDQYTLSVTNIPLFINPSDVFNNPTSPGFPPYEYVSINLNGTVLSENSITDWDIDNGLLKVGQIMSNNDNINVTYLYSQGNYVYEGYIGTSGVPSSFMELNLNPTPGLGYGIYASGIIATIYAKPYYNVTSSGVLNSSVLYHKFSYPSGVPSTPNSPLDFNLGSVSLGVNCNVNDVMITDVRSRAGGLNQDGINNLDTVESIQPESQFYWDVGYFDGQAVPADGVIVVNIPKSVLISNGGTLTKDEVSQKCYKHCALGTYIIFQYY